MTEQMILDRMSQLIRVGFVNARQPEKMRVKVTLPDTVGQPLVTDWLPVLCPRASGDMQYDLPDIGDQVLCLFLAYGLEQGFVLGAMYGRQSPPVASGDKWHRKFSDGAYLEYDRKSHALVADIPGKIIAKADESYTIESPIIYVKGTLVNTNKDGNPGKAVISGGLEVQNGGINVPDSDIVASGVSLTSHKTEGVQPGNSTSSHPAGGSVESKGTGTILPEMLEDTGALLAITSRMTVLEMDVKKRGMPIDNLILCLPDIAANEAEHCNPDNKKGWLYLYEMLRKWLAGISNPNALNNQTPFWIDIEWALSYLRVKAAYSMLTNKLFLFDEEAQKTLGSILSRDGHFTSPDNKEFNYITPDWKNWRPDYFQQIKVPGMVSFPPDGLMAAMGDFNLRVLAAGYSEVKSGHRFVHVERIAVFVWDSFNFDGDDDLGYWQCKPPAFSYLPFMGSTILNNADFRAFRQKYGRGEDFLVLSQLKNVDDFEAFSYEYKS